MKRLIKLIIAVMLVQMLPSSVLAEETVVFNEVFDNYITGSTPTVFTTGGAMNAYVTEDEKFDKALCIVKRADYAGKLLAAYEQISGEYILSFKLKPEGGVFSGGVRVSGKATETPVTFENNGIYTGAGKRYGTLEANKWTQFDIVFNENEERRTRYDLYINGEKVLEQWKVETKTFSAPNGIELYTRITSEDVKLYVDDIRVYRGNRVLEDESFPVKEYNPRSVDFVEKDYSVGNSVLIKEDFENGIAATVLGFTGTGHKEDYYDETRKSNCMYVNDTSYGNYNLFVNQSGIKALPKLVYQVDVCLKAYSGITELFQFRYNASSQPVRTARINEKGAGVLSLYDGSQVATLKLDTWYTIAAAYDYMTQTFDFYLDGQLLKEDMPFHDPNFNEPNSNRLIYWTLADKTQILVDNVGVYEGDAPRDIFSPDSEDSTTMAIAEKWTPDSVSENLLTATTAFHVSSGAVWKDNKKTYPESGTAFADENEVFYLPLRTIAENMGEEIGWDAATGSITVDGVSLKNGMTNVNIKGKDITLPGAVTIKDGITYIPSDIIAKDRLFSKKCIKTLGGLCVIDPPEYSEEELIELNRYMVGERPTPEKVKQDYLASKNKGVHPRLFADKDRFEELKVLIKEEGSFHKKKYEEYVAAADKFLAKGVMQYDAGRRLDNSNDIAKRVQTMSLLYRLTGEKKYLDRAYDEMCAVLEWPIWESGLNAGTIGYLLALGYDWLYDGLTPQQRKHLEQGMNTRVLKYLKSSYDTNTGWVRIESNWCFVSNAAAIAAFVLTDVYPNECYEVIANAARSLEFGLETFSPDGQWFEGPGYWGYAVNHMVPIFMAYNSVLGTDYRVSKFRGVDKTADYILCMQGPAGSYNYSDAVNSAPSTLPGIFYLAELYDRPEWITQGHRHNEENGFETYFTDFLCYKEQDAQRTMPNNMYFRSTYGDLAVLRGDSRDSNSLYLAYRAGKARVSHGHQDAGGFIMDMNGLRWAEELGREAYSVPGYNTMGESRWTFYKTRSEGHNTIVIGPDKNYERNLDGTAYVEKSDLKESGGYTIMNLDEVYNRKSNGYRRGFKIDDNRTSIVIRDEIDVKGTEDVYWFMHTKADIAVEGNRAILTQGEEKLCMDFITEGGAAEIYAAAAEPLPTSPNPEQQTKHVNYKKVAVKIKGSGRVNITVKMYDYKDREFVKPVDNTPLDSWTAPTYKLPERPKLTGIYFDGVPAESFSPDGGKMLYTYDYDGKKPTVTATCADDIEYEVKETEGADGKTIIDVTAFRKDNRASFRRYTVELKFIPYLRENLDGFTRYQPILVKPISEYDKTFPPENLSDTNLETRFATQGIGVDVADLDLGEVVEIDAFALGFYDALRRENVFDISVSEDGVNFKKVYSGKSTTLTDGYEIRMIEPVMARYVRYTGHGNSVNNWNNITEFNALKRN